MDTREGYDHIYSAPLDFEDRMVHRGSGVPTFDKRYALGLWYLIVFYKEVRSTVGDFVTLFKAPVI